MIRGFLVLIVLLSLGWIVASSFKRKGVANKSLSVLKNLALALLATAAVVIALIVAIDLFKTFTWVL